MGAVILVLSIFGYMYAEDQQGAVESAEGFLQGDNVDWNIVSSLSVAGIALGVLLVAIGLVPDKWYEESRSTWPIISLLYYV